MDFLVIDGHCDAIYKLMQHRKADFQDDRVLDVTADRLRAGRIALQSFAIFLEPEEAADPFVRALEAIDVFYERIVQFAGLLPVASRQDLLRCEAEGRTGALLTLEGAEAIDGDWSRLRILHRLGVRAIGPTWNHANWAADGALEPRGGGLTAAGKRLVTECEKLGILMDVSHLSEKAFWDLAETAQRPFYASHSNVYELCPHPRNLKREQLLALMEAGGIIGLTFVPDFTVPGGGNATADDLLRHIEYIGELGGSDHLAFGSDFDGIDTWIEGLEHPGKYANFRELLLKRYAEQEVDAWLHGNWRRFLYENLPAENEYKSI